MITRTTKNSERRVLTAIMAASAIMTISLSLSPMLAEAARAFPNADVATVQLLITLPSLSAMLSTVLAGMLERILSKKQILLLSIILMFLGGFASVLLHNNLSALLVASAFSGLGFGGVQTMTAALIPDYFFNDKRCAVMGYQSTAVVSGSALMVVASGFLAGIRWYYAYFSFALLIPTLLLVFLFLPRGGQKPTAVKQEKPNMRLGGVWVYVAFNVVFSVFITSYNTNIAMVVEETSLGASGAAGAYNAIFNISGAAMGLVAGMIIRKNVKGSILLSTILCGVGLLFCGIERGVFLLALGSLLAGAAFTLRAAALFEAAAVENPEKATLGIALVCASGAIGQFLTSIVINPVAELFSGTAQMRLITAGVGTFILLACMCFSAKRKVAKATPAH